MNLESKGIKKAHFHTKKDTLQRLEADLHVIQAIQKYNKILSNQPFAIFLQFYIQSIALFSFRNSSNHATINQ
jgi:hypothetical protein